MSKTNQLIRIDANAREFTEVVRHRFAEWGAALSPAQFTRREERLISTDFYKNGGKTWALVNDTNEVLASCETDPIFLQHQSDRRPGLVIASVVVPTQQRKRGYASELLRGVIDAESGRNDFYFLVSEVGAQLYGALGFRACPLEIMSIAVNSNCDAGPSLRVLELNADETLRMLDIQSIRPGTILSPSREHIRWHWERTQIYHEFLGSAPLSCFGLSVGSNFLVLGYDFKFSKLMILSNQIAVDASSQDIQELWNATIKLARLHGLGSVEAWHARRLRSQIAHLENLNPQTSLSREDMPMILDLRKDLDPADIEIEYQCWV